MIQVEPFSFEAMRWEDVSTVMAIEHRSFTLPWSANTYRHELLENKHAHYFVLRHRDQESIPRLRWLSRWMRRPPVLQMIGYGGFWMITDEAHISTIAIDIGWRGRSLGEYLLASMIDRSMALNAAQVTLEVRETNRVAQNLYRKYGFEITGKRLRYYQDNDENAFLMIAYGVNSEGYREKLRRLTANLQARLTQAAGSALPNGAAG